MSRFVVSDCIRFCRCAYKKNVPSYSECVRLGSVVSVVGDQGRTAVLCDPPGQLLNDDSALCTHLHVTPTLICLTHTNARLSFDTCEDRLTDIMHPQKVKTVLDGRQRIIF